MNRRVPWLVDGRTRRPDLPEGVGFSVVKDHGDGTVTVETTGGPSEVEERLDALVEALANATTIAQVRAAAGAARKPEPPDREPPTGPDRRP